MNSMTAIPADRTKRRVAVAAAGVVFALIAVALVLWAHLGTAVFFEAIRAGIAYCF